ncbi:long-chain fatty acid--CoA ligase [Alicyclobacillus dauci]|uniref:Long-chain fatty acid--CoA ligase n=1 Tax=Alicyclobacillus dauci TaxID=1475485 RepID=A0ABY6YZS1_9BACL|nr:long-chain fatty acid--CoA ligase [Alicyclobacillus dauci]WAH36010.1 long-chain fatty acid--CoA ligase [Alicyclobacillus dauci]
MMDYPLLLKSVLYRAITVFPEQEIAVRTATGMKRYTYADMAKRAAKLAHALKGLGVEVGDHVASFAWNNSRHLELYYGVPCSGRVLHTVNIRLSGEQIVYTINHAEDKVVFVDEDLVPLFVSIAPHLKTVQTYVILTDALTVDVDLPNAISYEALIQNESEQYAYPEFDENTPAIIGYTSATTGDPKGVVYSHRGLFLHCLTTMTGLVAVDERDVTMPVVPMFHVNAWGRPYTEMWAGAKVVLPGERPTAADLADLIQNEKVTFSAGVPTIWMGVLNHVLANRDRYDFSHVRYLLSGGAAMPLSLTKAYQEELGVTLLQGYGQTETSPVTFLSIPKARHSKLAGDELYRIRTKTGLLVPGLEIKLVDGNGVEVPHDGETRGELLIRGPWVISEYYKNPEATKSAFVDGWFRSGDIATMDADGYLQIVDRTKDLIKSGGEWISSVDLENTLMSHPDVLEAAVIGIPDEKWQERPLACVVARTESRSKVTEDDLRNYLTERVAKFWVPDIFVFIDEVPKTSVGKFSKKTLREWFQSGKLLGERV